MVEQQTRRGRLLWAAVGAAVAVAAIIATIVLTTSPEGESAPRPTPTASMEGTSPPTPPRFEDGKVADEASADRGWVPEPITTDAETYLRAALEAAGTADTTLSTREDWIAHLESWFTPDPRLTDPDEQVQQMNRYQLTMRDAVLFPEQVWDSLAAQDGRVVAATVGEVSLAPVPDYDGDDMTIGTADITLSFTEADDAGAEHSYDEQVRVSAQVLCGEASMPTPGSAQAPGNCKLIRYFDEPLSD